MSTHTTLFIVLAAIAALALAIFQYYINRQRAKINLYLAILRFFTWFCGFLLLINPKLTTEDYEIEKSNLVVLFDDSESVQLLGGADQARAIRSTIVESQELSERFSIESHSFSEVLSNLDSLKFTGKMTNLSNALKNLKQVYGTAKSNYIVISDGNQNIGADFQFEDLGPNATVFSLVVGDTTNYEDLFFSQINVNRYTFLNNQFPFEANVAYSGSGNVTTRLNVYLDGRRIFNEDLQLTRRSNSKTIQGLLKSNSVGFKNLRFELSPIASEKNIENNQRIVGIEVIDEQTKIALVSSILHPDLGMLKKSIETNEQRSVTIVNPTISAEKLGDYDYFILYQPNSQFREVFNVLNNTAAGSFIITGTKTDWNFLNTVQNDFNKEILNQYEDVIPIKNKAFGVFDFSDLEVLNFPPLRSGLGELKVNVDHDVLLKQQIRGINLESPLLFTFEKNSSRNALLLGENSWQWRAQNFREDKNFESFDQFMELLIRYLTDTNSRSRLELNYEPIFNTSSLAKISALYFDQAYNFQSQSSLQLSVKNLGDTNGFSIPMILQKNSFEADLSSLEAGDYEFTVTVENENISKSGRFKILEFNLEGQLVSANAEKLKVLAEGNNGQLFYPNQINQLRDMLLEDSSFAPVQKSIKNVVSLIDFRWLLALMALSLAAEWFIRKYNGLL